MMKIVSNVKDRMMNVNKNKKVTKENSIMKEMEEVKGEEKFDQRMFDVKLSTIRELRKAKKEGRTINHVEYMAEELVKYDKRKEKEIKKNVEKMIEDVVVKENIDKNSTVNNKTRENKDVEKIKETEDAKNGTVSNDKTKENVEKNVNKAKVKETKDFKNSVVSNDKTKENKDVKKFSRKEMNEEVKNNKQMSFSDAIDVMREYASGEREVELTDDGFVVYESWDDFMQANDYSDNDNAIENWSEGQELLV